MRGVDLQALAVTLALGAVGGLLAHAAHLPLGYLLGSMVLVGGLGWPAPNCLGWKGG